jgi:hypothetical protein
MSCPKCQRVQVPRVDIALPANNVDHHAQILSACQDQDSDDCDGTDADDDDEEEEVCMQTLQSSIYFVSRCSKYSVCCSCGPSYSNT